MVQQSNALCIASTAALTIASTAAHTDFFRRYIPSSHVKVLARRKGLKVGVPQQAAGEVRTTRQGQK